MITQTAIQQLFSTLPEPWRAAVLYQLLPETSHNLTTLNCQACSFVQSLHGLMTTC